MEGSETNNSTQRELQEPEEEVDEENKCDITHTILLLTRLTMRRLLTTTYNGTLSRVDAGSRLRPGDVVLSVDHVLLRHVNHGGGILNPMCLISGFDFGVSPLPFPPSGTLRSIHVR